jgi:hypothetical protein
MNAITSINAASEAIMFSEYSDAEKIRFIQNVWVSELSVKTAYLMIGMAVFGGMPHGEGARP